jgi:hypothetical protein
VKWTNSRAVPAVEVDAENDTLAVTATVTATATKVGAARLQ